MELKIIEESVFEQFVKIHPYGTFLQSLEEKKVKEWNGEKCYLLGLYQKKELVGVTMLIEIPARFHKNIYYAPRGFVTDYQNKEYVESFTKELYQFAKSNNGLEFIIDPYIIYQIYDKEEKVIEHHEEMITYLKKLGYHHYGFNQNFETSQVRFMYRIPVYETLEEMVSTFSKSTRKRIEEVHQKGVKVKVATKKDLPLVVELLKASAENKHFEYRSLEYYQTMMDSFKKQLTIYIASIQFDDYLKETKNLLEETNIEYDKLEEEMSKVNVGSKLLKKKELLLNHRKKYEEEIKQIQEYQKQYGKEKAIGALVSMRSHNEYITLSSGMLSEFREFNPKYAMYEAHMKDAVKEKFEYVNFYGISGNLDPKSELYGIYGLKKGYNGNIVELIGEFSYPVSKLYTPYHTLLKLKDKIK